MCAGQSPVTFEEHLLGFVWRLFGDRSGIVWGSFGVKPVEFDALVPSLMVTGSDSTS